VVQYLEEPKGEFATLGSARRGLAPQFVDFLRVGLVDGQLEVHPGGATEDGGQLVQTIQGPGWTVGLHNWNR